MARPQVIDQYEPVILEENDGEKSYRETVEDIMRAFESSEDDHNWEIRVFLVRGPAKKGFKQPWLFNCSPEDLPIDERLGREYGEGLYRCSVYHNGQLLKGFHREIGPAPKSAVQSAQDKSDIVLLIDTIRSETARTTEMFGQVLQRLATTPALPAAPPVDPMAMVTGIIGAMSALHGMMPKPAAVEGTSMKDLIEIFKSGVEMAQNAAGGGGDTGLADIVKALIQSPVLENVLKGQPGAAPAYTIDAAGAPIPDYRPNPNPAAPPQAPSAAPVLPADPDRMTPQQADMLVRQQLGYLVGRAKANSDPQLYAEWILDQMPEAMLEHVLQAPDIIAELIQLNPEIANLRHWFDRLLVEIRQMVQTDAAESEATPGPRNGAGASGSPAG